MFYKNEYYALCQSLIALFTCDVDTFIVRVLASSWQHSPLDHSDPQQDTLLHHQPQRVTRRKPDISGWLSAQCCHRSGLTQTRPHWSWCPWLQPPPPPGDGRASSPSHSSWTGSPTWTISCQDRANLDH